MIKDQRWKRQLILGLSLCSGLLLVGCGATQPPEPEPRTDRDSLDVGSPNCQRLIVPVEARKRVSSWRWSEAKDRWVETWGKWQPSDQKTRVANADDCLKVISQVPKNAALPDLQIKQMHRCGAGDMKATGGDCFKIVNPAPYVHDFPQLEGRKLLVFPVITINVGAGAQEIIADRTAKDAKDWRAYQTFYTARGKRLGSVFEPSVTFYFAGDEHNHWHIKDFDDYEILDAKGEVAERAEKHGYCLQDNTSYGPMEGLPGVPPEPGVYPFDTSCGNGLKSALTIIHGLSRGWGDTYPTTLPDQAIDITDLADGTYTVRVHADVRNAVDESNEKNNTASMKVTIKGDEVTTHPSTARGGIA